MNNFIFNTLEFDRIRERLAANARTAAGKDLCRKAGPSSDERAVRRLQKETAEAAFAIEKAGFPPVAGLIDGEDGIPLLQKLSVGATLSPRELLGVSALLSSAKDLLAYREKAEAVGEALNDCFEVLDPLPSLQKEISRCIVSEDEIADNASPALAAARRNIARLNGKVRDSLQRMLSSCSEFLSDSLITSRDDRYVLPVRAEFKSRVPGIVHGASATGQTLYIEPMAAVEANNAIREEEEKEAEEIRRILASLSASCALSKGIIEGDSIAVSRMDFIFARAEMGLSMDGISPEIIPEEDYRKGTAELTLNAARHPLLDPAKVVPVDIVVGGDYRILIITGPNTGGKTVSLKTLGLLALMAQSGFFVPAKAARLPVFGKVYADIGDAQSIEESLSTFSGHMKNIIGILKGCSDRDLILMDELCAGTDPAEGAALAAAILDYMRGKRVSAMVSTHYAELKSYALTTEGVQNASMEFDEETLSPTFRLIIGLPGKSNAFAISQRLGIPSSIIGQARKNMGTERLSLEDLLGNLERERRRAQSEADKQRKQNEILKSRLEKLEAREQKLEKQRDEVLKKANEKAANILADAKSQYDSAIRNLNRVEKSGNADMKALEKKRQELGARTKGRKERAAEDLSKLTPGRKLDPGKIEIGDAVKVVSMGGVTGTVHSLPDRKGNLEVRMGIITSKINIRDLVTAEDAGVTFEGAAVAGKKRMKQAAKPSSRAYTLSFEDGGDEESPYSKAATISPEIKLIGLTVDEAIIRLDKYLDDAFLAGLSSCRIVHGKGTGALRNAVCDFLRHDRRVSSFHQAEFGEGDAGVTIAEF